MTIEPEYFFNMEKVTESHKNGIEKGFLKGRKEGREEGRREIINNIFNSGASIEEISRLTNIDKLSIKEILYE